MIEILFSDSACGGMKMAQNCGNPEDIFGFHLALSVGDIKENEPGPRRQAVLERLFSVYPKDEGRQAAQELMQRAKDNFKKVYDRAAAGEDLRIWYSNQPDELCGLYWIMAQLNPLKERRGQINLVKLPEWEADENSNIIQRVSWGEMSPEDWQQYLAVQKPAPPVFCQCCASHWRQLQKENAPLRAVLNGQLVSVPETVYDDFILREIVAAGEEFQEARIIGRVIGNYQLGVSDSWIALRIEEMIREGKLEPVTTPAEDSPVYHRILRSKI